MFFRSDPCVFESCAVECNRLRSSNSVHLPRARRIDGAERKPFGGAAAGASRIGVSFKRRDGAGCKCAGLKNSDGWQTGSATASPMLRGVQPENFGGIVLNITAIFRSQRIKNSCLGSRVSCPEIDKDGRRETRNAKRKFKMLRQPGHMRPRLSRPSGLS